MVTRRPVRLEVAGTVLNADLSLPAGSKGLIIFAHGSGSSRHSSRNRTVAEVFEQRGFGTLLLDLLTEAEERADLVTAEFRFDIELLANRVAGALDWAHLQGSTGSLALGLFGASTGAAAALIAAAERPALAQAVVSRGGRADLAGGALHSVTAPTLLIVGGRDDVVLHLNREALLHLNGPKELQIVAGATHLFEEPGALDRVSQLACEWFDRYVRQESGRIGEGRR
jgi:putative phosphoribosyl transferase